MTVTSGASAWAGADGLRTSPPGWRVHLAAVGDASARVTGGTARTPGFSLVEGATTGDGADAAPVCHVEVDLTGDGEARVRCGHAPPVLLLDTREGAVRAVTDLGGSGTVRVPPGGLLLALSPGLIGSLA